MMALGMGFFELPVWCLLHFLNLWLYVSFQIREVLSHFYFRCFFSPTPSFLPGPNDTDFTLLLQFPTCLRLCSCFCLFPLLFRFTISLPVPKMTDPFLCPVYSAAEHIPWAFYFSTSIPQIHCGSVPDQHSAVSHTEFLVSQCI